MNIFHPLSKFNFLDIWYIEEDLITFFMIMIILMDALAFYFIFPLIREKRWKGLIPYYNWSIIYERFWSRRAFLEHLGIEIFGLLCPLIIEITRLPPAGVIIMTVLDFILSVFGIRHHWEINEKLFEHFGIPRKCLWLCLICDLSLFLIVFSEYSKEEV